MQYLLKGTLTRELVGAEDVDSPQRGWFWQLQVLPEALDDRERIVDRGREIIEDKADDAGTDVHNMVVKKFPETTHAHCIEYRLLSAEELNGLFNSARTAWETGHGRSFSIKKTSSSN